MDERGDLEPSERSPGQVPRTEREWHAEAALRRSERRRLLAVEAAGVGDYVIDLRTGLVEWGERALAMMRLGPGASPTLDEHHRLIHPEDRDRVRAELGRAAGLDGDGRYHAEFRFRFPDGEVRWIDSKGLAEPEAGGGDVVHVFGAMVDVTDRRRAEDRFREGEERNAFLLKLSDALRPLDDRLEIQRVAMRMLGERLGATRAFYFLTEPEEGGGWIHVIETDYRRDPGMTSHAGRHSVRDFGIGLFEGAERGRVVAIDDVTGVPQLTSAEVRKYLAIDVVAFINVPLIKAGRFVAGIGAHDRTPRPWGPAEVALIEQVAERIWAAVERARAEEGLRASEERLRAVAANLPNAAVFVVDADMRYTLAEGHALRTAGFMPHDLEGRTVAEAMGPAVAAEYEPNFRRALAGEEVSIEHTTHDRHFASHLTPLRDPAGRVVAALAVSYDITDRVHAEEEVRRARDGLEVRVGERTAELRAEVARRMDLARRLGTAQEDERRRVSRDLHDSIGQLMAGLSLALQAVEAAGELAAPVAGRLAEAKHVASLLGREVHGLAVRLRPTVLDDIGLEAALGQLVAEWSSRAGVRAEFQAAGVGLGRLNPEVETAVYRVVQEALTNVARHARATVVGVAVTRPDGHVAAVVEDDGTGFDPDAAPWGRLGLLGMRERVEQVGGAMAIESAPGSGTTISVRIPVPDGARPGR